MGLDDLYERPLHIKVPIQDTANQRSSGVKEDKLFKYRTTFNGAWEPIDLEFPALQVDTQLEFQPQGPEEFLWPQSAYNGNLFLISEFLHGKQKLRFIKITNAVVYFQSPCQFHMKNIKIYKY